MGDRQTKTYQRIEVDNPDAIRQAQINVLDMVRAKIEAGQVASLALLMVAKDPEVPGDPAYTGSRFLVQAAHLDLIEDVYNEMMRALIKQYCGITPDQLRADRARGGKRI